MKKIMILVGGGEFLGGAGVGGYGESECPRAPNAECKILCVC